MLDEGADLFARLAAGRPTVELMLRKADSDRWGKSNQARPIRVGEPIARPEFAVDRQIAADRREVSG